MLYEAALAGLQAEHGPLLLGRTEVLVGNVGKIHSPFISSLIVPMSHISQYSRIFLRSIVDNAPGRGMSNTLTCGK